MSIKLKILVLAGTREARELIKTLSLNADYDVTASLAGVTKNPHKLAVTTQMGGFGGAEGLMHYLQAEGITAVVDATHPYAAQITQNACEATKRATIPMLRFERAPWKRCPEDEWHLVDDLHAALELIPARETVFFAASSKVAAPFIQRPDLTAVIRSLNVPERKDALPNAVYVAGMPSADWREEVALFKQLNVGWLISKNSGGNSSYAKIRAARELKIPVAMIQRPGSYDGISCSSVECVLEQLKLIEVQA
ncbi:Precorrin-6A reductase [Pseudovibrio axinellae]|uniref:Precorrin-6A reductase n=1 Tax=Pseudovibrio axinellae TaxID=989403 RepID=A0A165YV74_9HYPH|nr:precorrin-6A/cobalt-precorrin-6A reductase [Pseudovibrio axinellae]KZL19264.1 Precorrin-6A reductase [Pseudovibrio axinellae]SEQ43661.1 precorrin-6A/cobalt-precorrin-6A reductase [Pseudovibrio axinellae]